MDFPDDVVAAGPAPPRLMDTLAKADFSATIGELKRQMDRQSRMFLQQDRSLAEGCSAREDAVNDQQEAVHVPGEERVGSGGDDAVLAAPEASASTSQPPPPDVRDDHARGDHVDDGPAPACPELKRSGTITLSSRGRGRRGGTSAMSLRSRGAVRAAPVPPPPSPRAAAPRSRPRPASRITPTRASGDTAARRRGALPRRPEAPRPGGAPQLLQLPLPVLMKIFALLPARDRTLAVSRHWVDLGLRAELWRGVHFDARGARGALCRRLDFAPSLRRLSISDRDDANHILETALRRCPGLGAVRLERCRGPGPVLHCGTFTPKSVTVLDTPVSNQLVQLLASACPGSRLEDCTITSNVDQAALLFASVLKMALVADGKSPELLKALSITFRPAAERAADAKAEDRGVLRWKRLGLKGTMSYNRVALDALFTRVND